MKLYCAESTGALILAGLLSVFVGCQNQTEPGDPQTGGKTNPSQPGGDPKPTPPSRPKPADGMTQNSPFPQGTGGSRSFRIPALISLSDGSLLAAADARWNTTYDGGGLDTIVSRSADGGKTWRYTFANYLGDGGNVYNGSSSSCFIDPALAYDGRIVYMLCDLYPYGVALNGSGNTHPTTDMGFDGQGRLLLKKNGETSYDYALEKGAVIDKNGNKIEGYTVDDYFYISWEGGESNLFFKDSPFQVQRTSYLYVTQSEDRGASWSTPQLLNLKKETERAYLASPSHGSVTAGGRIVFPCYSYDGQTETQRMDFIYSDDGGKSWKRSGAAPTGSWSSESALVELSDGTLRFFYRNGTTKLCYIDYKEGAWLSPVNTGRAINSNCQLSAIRYSKKSNGRDLILISCPTGPANGMGSADATGGPAAEGGKRLNGRIFAGAVNADSGMEWLSEKEIIVNDSDSEFMYSSLTELPDGRIALLYEDHQNGWGAGDDKFYTMDFKIYPALSLR